MTDENLIQYTAAVDSIHKAIGEFVVKFELVNHSIQQGIIFLLQSDGLQSQRVAEILIAGMTADPLRTLYQSLIFETQKLNQTEKKMLDNVFSRFHKLIQERNDIIHSTWFVGYFGNEITEEVNSAHGWKYHKNKAGSAPKFFSKDASSFNELTLEADELHKVFSRLSGMWIFRNSIERNFIFNSNGNLGIPING